MRVVLPGTGDAGGVPLYGCDCPACRRAASSPQFRRGPSCALVDGGGARVLVDAGQTGLDHRYPPGSLTAIAVTHFHPDHVQGLLHLRWGMGQRIPVYAPPDLDGFADLQKHPGLLEFRTLRPFESVPLAGLTLIPFPLNHSKPTFGFAIEEAGEGRFAYLSDTFGLPAETEAFLLGWKPTVVALDCSVAPGAGP